MRAHYATIALLMPMRPSDFRRIALGLEGAIESEHMNHPDFRAHGRIFATLNEDETRGMVSLTPEQQQQCLEDHPQMFVPASGAWGRQGATMVLLAEADAETVGEAMTLAWQNAAARAAKKTKARAARPAEAPKARAARPAEARKARAVRPAEARKASEGGSAGQKRRRHRQK